MSTHRVALARLFHGLCLPLLAAACAAQPEVVVPDKPAAAAIEESAPTGAARIPQQLTVPNGNPFAFESRAEGVQIYTCQDTGNGIFAWAFSAPEAKLFDRHGQEAGYHSAGPTWQAVDGSMVVGSKLAATDVDATAIPWLLLQATSHGGEGLMSRISYIQRLETTGGLIPTTGCDAAHSGESARVPYTASYAFYLPSPATKN